MSRSHLHCWQQSNDHDDDAQIVKLYAQLDLAASSLLEIAEAVSRVRRTGRVIDRSQIPRLVHAATQHRCRFCAIDRSCTKMDASNSPETILQSRRSAPPRPPKKSDETPLHIDDIRPPPI